MAMNPRLKQIFSLSLPIIGGMVSQNVMNLVDTAMVGRLGNASLAAVGLASFLVFFSQAFLTGLSTGVQAMVARLKGAGQESQLAGPLHGGLCLAFVVGVPCSVLLFTFSDEFYSLFNNDPEVVEIGSAYYQVRVLAIVAVGMNFCFRGYWNAVNLSMVYMRTIIAMHVVNIVLNYALIFGHFGAPEMGATGAAVGTTIATVLGTVLYFGLAATRARHAGFLRSIPSLDLIRRLLALSFPTGIQQLFFAAGFSMLFLIVGLVGTVELAAANILINIILVGILPGIGLGLAATSLVGQALGRGDVADARAWGFDVLKCGLVILGILGVPMWLMPEQIIGVFVQETETIEVATWPMRIAGAGLFVDAVGLVLQHALLGAGDTRRTALVSIGMQWVFFLPVAYLVGPVMGYGLLGIWLAQMVYRFVQAVLFMLMWRGQKWVHIKV